MCCVCSGSTFPKQGSSGGKSGIPQWLRQLIEASPDERDELTDAVVAPLIANVVTRTDVRTCNYNISVYVMCGVCLCARVVCVVRGNR